MRFWFALAAVLAGALGYYTYPYPAVRTPDGVRLLGDTDPHYHVLRAERMARGAPGAPWRDPSLNSPLGADVPWPPLFDGVLVAAAALAGAETRDEFAMAAALVPVVLGVLSILLVALAGRALAGPGTGLAAAAVAVPLPALARYASIGRVDHHVAEVLLATAVALAFTQSVRFPRSRAAVIALALSIALSFWTWMGSTVALLAPSVFVALAHVGGARELVQRASRALALGAGVAALVLAVTIASWGAPGAFHSTSVLGIGGLHVAIVAGAALFGAVIAWRATRACTLPRRALDVVVAVTLPAVVLFASWPGLAEGARRGLVALTASNSWYEDIREFKPALFGGIRPLRDEIASGLGAVGVLPVLGLLAFPAALERWRADPERRTGLAMLTVWTGVTLALALARNRFFPYFAVPLAIASAMGARWLAARIASEARTPAVPWVTAALLAASLLPCAPTIARIAAGAERVPDRWIDAARWLHRAAPAPDGRSSVAAPWSFGHLVQYYADRPVIATPFGTEGGERALQDWARFLFATDDTEAEGVLLGRRVSHLVLMNPSHELVALRGFAPPGVPHPLQVTRHPLAGERVEVTPRYGDLVVTRLYFLDGNGPRGGIEAARLLFEGPSTLPIHPLREERLKVFGLVAGAEVRVSGAASGATVIASVPIHTNSGRAFTWRTRRVADASGSVTLRIPYATGENGATQAGPCEITDGRARISANVSGDAVETGAEVRIALRSAFAQR